MLPISAAPSSGVSADRDIRLDTPVMEVPETGTDNGPTDWPLRKGKKNQLAGPSSDVLRLPTSQYGPLQVTMSKVLP